MWQTICSLPNAHSQVRKSKEESCIKCSFYSSWCCQRYFGVCNIRHFSSSSSPANEPKLAKDPRLDGGWMLLFLSYSGTIHLVRYSSNPKESYGCLDSTINASSESNGTTGKYFLNCPYTSIF